MDRLPDIVSTMLSGLGTSESLLKSGWLCMARSCGYTTAVPRLGPPSVAARSGVDCVAGDASGRLRTSTSGDLPLEVGVLTVTEEVALSRVGIGSDGVEGTNLGNSL